jgi:putative transposase
LVQGRKRHICVDTQGLLLAVWVSPANTGDRDGARELLGFCHGTYPRLSLVWADGGYGGPLVEEVSAAYGLTLQIVEKPQGQKGFTLLARRWVVERTFAWLGKYRRLSKDYEALPQSSEAMIRLAMVHIMLRRLAQ